MMLYPCSTCGCFCITSFERSKLADLQDEHKAVLVAEICSAAVGDREVPQLGIKNGLLGVTGAWTVP